MVKKIEARVAKELIAEGHYATRPREQIVRLLAEQPRYLSAAEIVARLRAKHTFVSRATVYRTLDLLSDGGFVSARVDEHGESSYVACGSGHHHHAICRKCGRVEDIACSVTELFRKQLREHHNFELDAHSAEFSGLCGRCR